MQQNRKTRSKSRALVALCARGALALTMAVALATVVSCGGGSDLPLQVDPGNVASQVTVSAGTSTLSPAQTLQLSAIGRTAGGVSVPSTTFTWNSSNLGVATVNSSGVVTAVAAGTATVTAIANSGAQGSLTLTVITASGTVTTVNVALSDTTVQIGNLSQATVTARDALNQVIAVGTRPLVWSSTNPSIATVSDGLVTAVGIGTAQIRATVTEGTNQVIGSVTVASVANADAKATQDVSMPGLTFSPADVVVKVNGNVRFIFPVMEHNVFWRPTVPGQPADITTTHSVEVTRTFPTVGVYQYVCTLHDGMKGTVVVSP